MGTWHTSHYQVLMDIEVLISGQKKSYQELNQDPMNKTNLFHFLSFTTRKPNWNYNFVCSTYYYRMIVYFILKSWDHLLLLVSHKIMIMFLHSPVSVNMFSKQERDLFILTVCFLSVFLLLFKCMFFVYLKFPPVPLQLSHAAELKWMAFIIYYMLYYMLFLHKAEEMFKIRQRKSSVNEQKVRLRGNNKPW
jgi:hypothetical protein